MSTVTVVGLGKIGLPLACAIARGGHTVFGADVDEGVVEKIESLVEPFPGEAGLAEALAELVPSGRLVPTTRTTEAVDRSDVVVIVVPLVVDDEAKPDFGMMDAATAAVGDGLRPGTLVIYETTLPVGTTRQRFAPALRERSGLEANELFVVHSPERVFSGRIFEDLRRYPKLVGGVDGPSGARAVDFYRSFLTFDDRADLDRPNDVWDLGTAEAAELAKLAETTYRDLNIAYANELAAAADSIGADVFAVIEACNSQPFSHIHRPGVSVGGHCIPVYPHFLLGSTDGMRLPRVARERNAAQPASAVADLAGALGGLAGATVLVLGLAYRPGVKEHAFSGAFSLARALEDAGASVLVADPLYAAAEVQALGLTAWAGERVDAAMLHTEHEEYRRLGSRDLPGAAVVYDGRHVLDAGAWDDVRLIGPGRPASSHVSGTVAGSDAADG